MGIKGGLGNQMFQFAAGYAKALQLEGSLSLDTSYYDSDGKRVFLLDEFMLNDRVSVYDPDAKRRALSLFKGRPKLKVYQESSFSYDDSFVSVEGAVRLEGYFQSEKNFENYKDQVYQAFKLAKSLSTEAVETARKISESQVSVSVHVRRGDYLDSENVKVHCSLSTDYYLTALSFFKSILGENLSVFYFSDDPAYVRQKFNIGTDDHIVCGDTVRPAEDMYLMSKCTHHIIANSSFSWWGAWLNRRAEKRVIAPRQWFQPDVMRRMNTCDLYPSGWMTI